ncbi:hypothetical protein VNO77_43287 [Canavalia gladiata]|uniref:Uncharacterized protein n=1 Tax=Canavalia gladiata TaxID=3824 RepID=A0AAN9JUJ4_CANGL
MLCLLSLSSSFFSSTRVEREKLERDFCGTPYKLDGMIYPSGQLCFASKLRIIFFLASLFLFYFVFLKKQGVSLWLMLDMLISEAKFEDFGAGSVVGIDCYTIICE